MASTASVVAGVVCRSVPCDDGRAPGEMPGAFRRRQTYHELKRTEGRAYRCDGRAIGSEAECSEKGSRRRGAFVRRGSSFREENGCARRMGMVA